jgi:hypothetical protein
MSCILVTKILLSILVTLNSGQIWEDLCIELTNQQT